MLTDPEMNVRLGMKNFADSLKSFGEPYLALASYNAGDRAVRRWVQERPGLEREEFIDDIPYPETQNYVKRILGTAEDYRRLYGPDGSADATDAIPAVAEAPAAAASKAAPAKAGATKKKPPVKKKAAAQKKKAA